MLLQKHSLRWNLLKCLHHKYKKKTITCFFKYYLKKTFLHLNVLLKKIFCVLPIVFLKSFPGSTYKDVKLSYPLSKTFFFKPRRKALSLSVSHHQRGPFPLWFSIHPNVNLHKAITYYFHNPCSKVWRKCLMPLNSMKQTGSLVSQTV